MAPQAPDTEVKEIDLQARPAETKSGGRILVTGASGFVGSHLVESLVKAGHRVRILVRRSSRLQWVRGLPLELAYGDVRDKASLSGACVGVQSVFHFGALVTARTESEFYEANEIGTRNLAEALAERGEPGGFFVYCSSLAAGGPAIATQSTHEPERTEDDADFPITPYGKSKLAGERSVDAVAHASGRFRVAILRPPAVYGPRDSAILKFFRIVKNGILPIGGPEGARLSLIHVDDLVRAATEAASKEAEGVYYVSDGDAHTWMEVGNLAGELMHTEPRVIRVPEMIAKLVAVSGEAVGWVTRKPTILNRWKIQDMRQQHWVCSPERARNDWGFEPSVQIEDGLQSTLLWYRENGWI